MTGLPVRCRAGRAGGPRAWDTEGQRPCARGAGGLAGRRDGPTCQEGVRSALPNRGRNGVSALRRDPGPDPSGLGGAPQLRVHSPGEPAACAQGRARHLENPSCQGPEAEELAEPQGGRRTHRGCWGPRDLRALWGGRRARAGSALRKRQRRVSEAQGQRPPQHRGRAEPGRNPSRFRDHRGRPLLQGSLT